MLLLATAAAAGCAEIERYHDDRLSWPSLATLDQRRDSARSNPACLALSPEEVLQLAGRTPTSVESFRSAGPSSSLCRFVIGPADWFYVGIQAFPHSADVPLWCDDRVVDYPNPPKYLPHCSEIRRERWITVDSKSPNITRAQMTELLRHAVPRLSTP